MGKRWTIVGEPAKSNRAPAIAPAGTLAALKSWCEQGLGCCVFLLPALLALVPRGAAPLAAAAGLCAAALVAAGPPARLGGLRIPAAVFGLLLLWGAASAGWAVDPARSLLTEARLAGLFAAALAIAAASGLVAAPRRLALMALAGTGIAIILAAYDLGTGGGISGYVTVRHFATPRLNQIAVWLAILVLPATALLLGRGHTVVAVLAAGAMGGTVCLLDGTAAKTALALSLPAAALVYVNRRAAARIAAAASVVAVLAAPAILPRLADEPAIFEPADAFKNSLGHRLLIWDFAGKRIAERPLLGWGLDSSRSIPGGRDQFRPGQDRLPLHPHNAALQLWLELGAPGAALLALLLAWLWLRLAAAPWPPLYAAAAGGSIAAVSAVLFAGWGIWQEWWLATLMMAVFAVVVMGGAAAEPAIPQPPRGSRASGR